MKKVRLQNPVPSTAAERLYVPMAPQPRQEGQDALALFQTPQDHQGDALPPGSRS